MRSITRLLLTASAAAVLMGSAAHATTLTGAITADNEYNLYLSTSDGVLGTQIATGAWWPTAQIFSTNLAAGQTYYLHVVANNWYGVGNMGGGNPDALLGSFALSDANHLFANGGAALDTDTTHWTADPNGFVQALNAVSPSSWFAPSSAPVSWATNGTGIWGGALGGPVANISTSAKWIWSAADPSGEAFFSTKISAAVPEPAAWALMIGGFGMAGAMLRRRRALALAA